MFQLGGLTFHWYGLILGLAIACGWLVILQQAKRHQLKIDFLENAFLWLIIGGVIGARAYHVLTDWPHYQGQWLSALFIWQGGLSIIGAVMCGLLTLWWLAHRDRTVKDNWRAYLDVSVFGLPLAQAVGRLGNWANQELYGLPTQLPWKLFIDVQHRLPGYEQVAYYHPLFAYEALALVGFGVVLWAWDRHQTITLGNGRLFASYIAYYSIVRFVLDFLRLDAVRLPGVWLSINQVVMLIVLVVSIIFLVISRAKYGNQ